MKFKTQIHYSIELSDNYWFRRSEESARKAHGVSAYGELHFQTKAQVLDWVKVIYAEYVKHTDGTMDATYINRRPVGAEFEVQYRAAGETTYEIGSGMVYAETPVEYRTISRKKVTKTVEVDGEIYTKTVEETVCGAWESSPDVLQRICFSIAEWTFHLPEDAEDELPSERRERREQRLRELGFEELTQDQRAWNRFINLGVVDGADAIGLGAEPAPTGPIPMLLEGVRDAENTLDPDDFKE